MTTQPTVKTLADAFRRKVQKALTPEHLAEADRRDAARGYGCATHDFCDANVLMEAAFVSVMRRSSLPTDDEESGMTEADCALWNAAWDQTARDGFSKPVTAQRNAGMTIQELVMAKRKADGLHVRVTRKDGTAFDYYATNAASRDDFIRCATGAGYTFS